MQKIQTITSDPLQIQSFTLTDGSQLQLTLYYRPRQIGWFITNLTYNSFVVNGFRIINSPNMLYQWKNEIPFGLACVTSGGREPTQQQDFASGASVLYILNQSEVEQYSEFLSNG